MITRLCLTRARSQCDGDRPACFHCRSQSITCVYRGNAAFPLQTNKLVFEVVQLLGAMPQDEASRVLRVLRGEHDASVILSVLRGGMDSKQRPSDLSNAATIMDDSFQSVELATNFPVAYPRLPLIRVEALRAGRYDNLTKPIADQRSVTQTCRHCSSCISASELTGWQNRKWPWYAAGRTVVGRQAPRRSAVRRAPVKNQHCAVDQCPHLEPCRGPGHIAVPAD
jgi:hypothetical protein